MPNINEFDRLFRETITRKSDGSTNYRLRLARVQTKRIRVLTHVTVENRTHAYTKARLGIKSGARDHYLDELQTIDADELAVSRTDIILGEGDEFFAELTGTTTDDELILTCIGWELTTPKH